MSRTRVWKQLTVLLFVLVALSCKKQQQQPSIEDPETEHPQPVASLYEPYAATGSLSLFGSYSTDLKIESGDNIGIVTVGNDATFLYLTYNLSGDWFLTGVQSYAGEKALIPSDAQGNPNHIGFPGHQELAACDKVQNFTFRVRLADVKADQREICPSGLQYFVAMRASVKAIANGDACTDGQDQEAWGAPVLINPGGNLENWATAFFYCQQRCAPWLSRGQGYWFASGKHHWCGDVVFGSLVVSKEAGVALWDQKGKPSAAQKAFFKAAAVQLSLRCLNNEEEIPESIQADYETISAILSSIGLDGLKDSKVKLTKEQEEMLKTATQNLGKWLCSNSCNEPADPSACQEDEG